MQNYERVRTFVRALRDLNPELPIQQLAILLEVYGRPGMTFQELGRVLGMPGGSLSRNIKALSAYLDNSRGTAKLKGLGLVETKPDLMYRSQLGVWLTSAGQALLDKYLKNVINGPAPAA